MVFEACILAFYGIPAAMPLLLSALWTVRTLRAAILWARHILPEFGPSRTENVLSVHSSATLNGKRRTHKKLGACRIEDVMVTWVVIKIMVPFWVPIIIRPLIFWVPQKGTIILITTHMKTYTAGCTISQDPVELNEVPPKLKTSCMLPESLEGNKAVIIRAEVNVIALAVATLLGQG